jgi:hypothetical protein
MTVAVQVTGARKRHNTKLTPEQVTELRRRYREGIRRKASGPTIRELAALYRISVSQVKRVAYFRQWKDVA